MKRQIVALLLILVAVSFGFSQTKVVVNEWRIPFLNCLTGPIAAIGEFLQWGANYAANEINAAGGIAGKPVRVIPVDTGNDPQKGSVEMARIVKDSLVAMGPVPEPVILACLLYTSDAADDLLCVDLGGRRIIKKKNKNT